MSRPMRFHPMARTIFCQILALAGFVAFLAVLPGGGSTRKEAGPSKKASGAAALVGASTDKKKKPEPKKKKREQKPPEKTKKARRKKPRQPEQFRPASRKSKDSSTLPQQPKAAGGRPKTGKKVAIPPKDLPLSYLTEFEDMEDFHSFLDEVQKEVDPDARTMSLIRIEGLPTSPEKLRGLMESYRMRPFLFNPDQFNYLIKHDLELLKSPKAIQQYISRVGRYIRAEDANSAYERVKKQLIEKARGQKDLRKLLGSGEFDRMELGLASRKLTAFLHRVEKDTVRQVRKLTGRQLSRKDIARIDCRYRTVNGAVVLVPWRAYLGTDPDKKPIKIWKEQTVARQPRERP